MSSVWQLFWHSDPLSPGFALEQLKKTIGLVHADDNDVCVTKDTTVCFELLILCFAGKGIIR